MLFLRFDSIRSHCITNAYIVRSGMQACALLVAKTCEPVYCACKEKNIIKK